jgi:DNA (cytosine-5)-methyltransferase 1
VQKQIAVWNTDLKLWTKPNEVLFSEHLELFSATWPTSGMTQSGVAYELVIQVPHINDSESLLLRTPLASEAFGGALGEAEARKRGNSVQVRDQALEIAKLQGYKVSRKSANLPTPVAQDGSGAMTPEARANSGQGYGPALRDIKYLIGTPRGNAANSSQKQVEAGAPKGRIEDQVKLFPTLRASDGYERRNQKTMDRIARDGGDMTMTTLARTTTDWGKFEPAIRRWETILDRPAPEPTKPDGKDNNHRLSSKFTEWMMGLPDGWITGHDLKRNDELKLAGNGVVPQQAELALRLLLELPERKENDNE